MKRIYGLAILLLLVANAKGQDWFSAAAINGDLDINVINSTVTPEAATVVLGTFSGTIQSESGIEVTSNGGRDYYMANFTAEGEVTWMNNIGSTGNDYVLGGICACVDNFIYVTGGFRNTIKFTEADSLVSNGGFDTFLARYDLSGNLVWARTLGLSARNERPSTLKVDDAGNLLISGFFNDSIEFDAGQTIYNTDATDDYYYGKFDAATGDRIWVKQIKGIDGVNSGRIFGIAVHTDAYYFAGQFADSVVIENDTLVSETPAMFDVHLFKTDLDGNVQWVRTIKGNTDEYLGSVDVDNTGDVYISGWYDSNAPITVDQDDNNVINAPQSNGKDDFYIAEYSSDGILQWFKTAGGTDTDKMYDNTYYQGDLWSTGTFADQLGWGGNILITEDRADNDMFVGSIDLNGNFVSASDTEGNAGELSTEEGRSIFSLGDTALAAVMTTNTTLLQLAGEIFLNAVASNFVVVGYIGCQPIALEEVVVDNVIGCYGDSTGEIDVVIDPAVNGFGGPFQYSIDGGQTYQASSRFQDLPAESYQIQVLDAQGCGEILDTLVTIDQPDSIVIAYTSTDIDCYGAGTGEIQLTVSGGASPRQYSVDFGNNFQVSQSFTGLAADTFGIVVQDFYNCVAEGDSVFLTQNTEIVIDEITSTNMEFNTYEDLKTEGEIVVTASGGTPPYTYTLQPGNLSQPDNNTFTFSSPDAIGTYTVEVTDDLGCGPAESSQVEMDSTVLTGLLNVSLLNASIYPNPATGQVRLEFQAEEADLSLEVISMSGATVMTREIRSHHGMVSEVLDVSSLDKGMYLIRVNEKTLGTALVIQ